MSTILVCVVEVAAGKKIVHVYETMCTPAMCSILNQGSFDY